MITRDELIQALQEYTKNNDDPECTHVKIDNMLIEYINDKEIKELWEKVEMWYA